VTTGGPGWESAASSSGTTAVKKVTVRSDGSTDTTKITTYGDGQLIEGYTLVVTTANGVRTFACDYDRRHYITDKIGPSVHAKGRTKITDSGTKIEWRTAFLDTDGHETDQRGTASFNPDGSGKQVISTTYAVDGSGQSDTVTWTTTTEASCHTEKFDTNGETQSVSDRTLTSEGGGAWVDTAARPDDGTQQDTLPPPYGPRGPVLAGDLIATRPSPSSS
jgi:hypothetical protein